MKSNYQYTLDASPKKFICPGCGKKRFVKYIDQATGEYLPDQFGSCDRKINCGYHLNPYKAGYGKNPDGNANLPKWTPPPPEPPKPTSYIDTKIFKVSREGYDQNNFVKWLLTIFDEPTVNDLIARYHIGTCKHWPGAVVFWQIDQAGKIRTGKIMAYNPTTGRRIKEPFNHIQWVHKVLKLPDFNLIQCYFGLHSINKEPQKPVALVESEKTAVVASQYFPGFIWLAVGSLTNINPDKCKPLAGRRVVLFPDLGGFEKWSQKAAELQKAIPGTVFSVDDILERGATSIDRENGLDLCDFLTKFDWRTFAGNDPPPQQPKTLMEHPEPGTRATDQEPKKAEPIRDESLKSEKGEKSEALKTNYFYSDDHWLPLYRKPDPPKPQPETWPIDEVEAFFQNTTLPDFPLQINSWTTITNVPLFVEAQLTESKAKNGNPYFKAGWESLIELKNLLIDTTTQSLND